MSRITPFQIAMGIGTAGALTDVSSYADLAAGVQRSWGRRTEFEDIAPGVFSFVLDNSDGRFTPGNTASPLTTTVTEGMAVCWNTGGRLVAGTILAIEPTFPSDESAWAQIRITCVDVLGAAGRREVADGTLAAAVLDAADPFILWPLDDDASSTTGRETTNSGVGQLSTVTGTFGLPGVDESLGTAFGGGEGVGLGYLPAKPLGFKYSSTDHGYWSCWAAPTASNKFYMLVHDGLGISYLYFDWNRNVPNKFSVWSDTGSAWTPPADFFDTEWHFFSYLSELVGGNLIQSLYVDGVQVISLNRGALPLMGNQIASVQFSGYPTDTRVSRISHSRYLPREDLAIAGTTAGYFAALAAMIPATANISSDISPSAISSTVSAGSIMDNLNVANRTEQGAMYSSVSGTLTSPTETLVIRDRARPANVSASWNVELELDGAPSFVRDITNMVASVTSVSPTQNVTYSDPDLALRASYANTSEEILYADFSSMLGWDQDRLQRGANVQLRVASVTIDAMTTPTDRTSDLLALTPGDRHRFTNLPSTQLGFSTWDGWLLGVEETHTLTEHTFTLYFQPALSDTGIFDTSVYAADGELSLSAAINSSVTSMSVTTSNALVLLETTAFPYTLVIDSEWLSVTACTSAAPQVVTVVRGVGGTVAAAHSSGALVDVAPYLSLPRYPSTTRYPSTSLYPTAVRERPYYAF